MVLFAGCKGEIDVELKNLTKSNLINDKETSALVLNYSANSGVYVENLVMPNNVPRSTAIFSKYTVVPALPAGMSIDPITGIITGTPTAVQMPADYVVTAIGSDGKADAKLRFEVISAPALPIELEFEKADLSIFETNTTQVVTVNVLLSSPSPVTTTVSWSINPSTSGLYLVDHDLPNSGIINISAGESRGSLSFNVYSDAIAGGLKTIYIAINDRAYPNIFSIASKQIVRVAKVDDESERFVKVAAGYFHSCGISSTGVLKCWGENSSGRLGDGTTVSKSSPVVIDGGVAYQAVSLGTYHSCAVTTTGVLKCWGDNSNGQLGDGTAIDKSVPVVIDSGVVYSGVGLGSYHSCGITSTGVLKCWGHNAWNQLGDGTTINKNSPIVIDSGVAYITFNAGSTHNCGITNTSALKCWGGNGGGQVGDGTTVNKSLPIVIESGIIYSSIDLSGAHSCGITNSGVLKCWGSNNQGQVGDGSFISKSVPVVIDSGVVYSGVGLGSFHSCAITNTGVLKCWGYDRYGQLGLAVPDNLYPVTVW